MMTGDADPPREKLNYYELLIRYHVEHNAYLQASQRVTSWLYNQ
jgi:hypothetical protein